MLSLQKTRLRIAVLAYQLTTDKITKKCPIFAGDVHRMNGKKLVKRICDKAGDVRLGRPG